MAPRKRSASTIAAMLSSAPPLTPVTEDAPAPDADHTPVVVPDTVTPELQRGEEVYETTAVEVRPARLQPVEVNDPDEIDEWGDPDELKTFAFEAAAPLVRPRKRKAVDYQTLRIHKSTWQALRQAWLMARKVDPLVSFVEMSTLVVQKGMQALKAEMEAQQREG